VVSHLERQRSLADSPAMQTGDRDSPSSALLSVRQFIRAASEVADRRWKLMKRCGSGRARGLIDVRDLVASYYIAINLAGGWCTARLQ